MSNELKAKQYHVDVIFDPELAIPGGDPFSYGGDVEGKTFSITVDSNLAWFELHLKTKSGDQDAVFTTVVVQWLTPQREPMKTPEAFAVQRTGNDQATILNMNRVAVEGDVVSFNFEIGVVYKGRTYTSPDPTIINVDPTGPPSLAAQGLPEGRTGVLNAPAVA